MRTEAAPTQTRTNGTETGVFEISVYEDFSDDPFGRFATDGDPEYGDFSGSRFREEFLKPALQKHSKVHVDLNRNHYGSSFLEESFGGLVRKGYFTAEDLAKRLSVSHNLESYVKNVWNYINRAEFGVG